MKSEERHELETNVLAQFLAQTIEKGRPYASSILLGLVALIAVCGIGSLTSRSISNQSAEGWDSYVIATLPGKYDADAVKQTADQYPNKPVGQLALLTWADGQLQQAGFYYLSNKEQSQKQLGEAEQAYRSVLSTTKQDLLVHRATIGLARALEMKGEIDEAKKMYQLVAGPYESLAQQRITQLEELQPQEYVAWLSEAQARTSGPAVGAANDFTPDFSPDQLDLSSGLPDETPADTAPNFDDMLQRLQQQLDDRQPPVTAQTPETENTPTTEEPATDQAPQPEVTPEPAPTAEPETEPTPPQPETAPESDSTEADSDESGAVEEAAAEDESPGENGLEEN